MVNEKGLINRRAIGEIMYNKRLIGKVILNKKVLYDGAYLFVEKLVVNLLRSNEFSDTNMVYTNDTFTLK